MTSTCTAEVGCSDILVQIRARFLAASNFRPRNASCRHTCSAQRRAIFADSAGEDDRVHAAQYRQHRPDFARQPMRVRSGRPGAPAHCPLDGLQNLAHVAGEPETPSSPDSLVEDFISLIGGIAAVPDQINQDAGIDGARSACPS